MLSYEDPSMGTLKQTDVVAGDWKSLEELRLDGDEVCLLLCQLGVENIALPSLSLRISSGT